MIKSAASEPKSRNPGAALGRQLRLQKPGASGLPWIPGFWVFQIREFDHGFQIRFGVSGPRDQSGSARHAEMPAAAFGCIFNKFSQGSSLSMWK